MDEEHRRSGRQILTLARSGVALAAWTVVFFPFASKPKWAAPPDLLAYRVSTVNRTPSASDIPVRITLLLACRIGSPIAA